MPQHIQHDPAGKLSEKDSNDSGLRLPRRPKVVAVDFDDVLFNFYDGFLLFMNDFYKTAFERHELCQWDLEGIWGVSRQEMRERINAFYMLPYHDHAEPLPGALEGVALLSKHAELHIISAKPAYMRERVEAWLGRYFPGAFKSVHFTSKTDYDVEAPTPKETIARELGAQAFIDDAIHNAEAMAAAGIPALLVDTPWNQRKLPDGVFRVHSWSEILEKLGY